MSKGASLPSRDGYTVGPMRLVVIGVLALAGYAWYQEKTIKALRGEVERLHEERTRFDIRIWDGEGWVTL